MIAIDTNVLARFYCDDPSDPEAHRQRPAARRVMTVSKAVYVALTVVLEFEWIMRGFYELLPEQVCMSWNICWGCPTSPWNAGRWSRTPQACIAWASTSRMRCIGRRARQARSALRVTADAPFERFALLLARGGIRPALEYLVSLSDYRFISIFRFLEGKATSAVHVDRSDLSILQADEAPDTATYCCCIRDEGGAFCTADASVDPKTATHPARDVVPSYCGIPILMPEGDLIGTLCLYDVVPRDPDQIGFGLSRAAAASPAKARAAQSPARARPR